MSYTLSTDDSTVATSAQETLETSEFVDNLNEEIGTTLPETSVTDVSADEDIVMELVVTIDATESSVDLDEANDQAVTDLENQGYSTSSESIAHWHDLIKYIHAILYLLSILRYFPADHAADHSSHIQCTNLCTIYDRSCRDV